MTIGTLVTNSWSCSTITTITAGKAKSIKSGCEVLGYGAVNHWPFVGQVHHAYPTATGSKSPWLFSYSATFIAFATQMTLSPTATITTSNGQFTMNANG